MDRKVLLPLFISSAMFFMWACGEGDIVYVTDADEMVKKKIEEADSIEMAKSFIKQYCKGKKNCDVELVVHSSSSDEEESSSSVSKDKSSSSKSKSSSSGKNSSGSTKSSSSTKYSSSGDDSGSSDSKESSSSKKTDPQHVSGKCELLMPDVVHVGDEVIWRYLPDDGSKDSADFNWDLNNEIEKNIVSGKITGSGLPEITVKFQKAGKKFGPGIYFDGEYFDCDNLTVYEEGGGPATSSSAVDKPSSSSVAKSSSSQAKSSSSALPEGHCAVSKREIFVGEEVDWYVAGPDGSTLSAKHNWMDIGIGGELVSGEQRGNGSTKITVKYSSIGNKEPMVQFTTEVLACGTDSEGDPMLVVKAKEVSSSSEEVILVSSSSGEPKPSSSNSTPSSSFDPGIIDF